MSNFYCHCWCFFVEVSCFVLFIFGLFSIWMLFFSRRNVPNVLWWDDQPYFSFLLLCLTFAKRNVNISLAQKHFFFGNDHRQTTQVTFTFGRYGFNLVSDWSGLREANAAVSCILHSWNKHACSNQQPCQCLSICCHCETLCIISVAVFIWWIYVVLPYIISFAFF